MRSSEVCALQVTFLGGEKRNRDLDNRFGFSCGPNRLQNNYAVLKSDWTQYFRCQLFWYYYQICNILLS